MIEYYLYKTYVVIYSADKNPRDIPKNVDILFLRPKVQK